MSGNRAEWAALADSLFGEELTGGGLRVLDEDARQAVAELAEEAAICQVLIKRIRERPNDPAIKEAVQDILARVRAEKANASQNVGVPEGEAAFALVRLRRMIFETGVTATEEPAPPLRSFALPPKQEG